MEVHRHLIGTDEMTVHRSAAIIRMPGSAPVRWHSDWQGFGEGPPKNAGEVLNRGLWPSGKWIYITGSRPVHGGLFVIEDSHEEDWEGPEGFALTGDRRSFYPGGAEESSCDGFDIPGLIPLFTDPGDMIVFAHRTYHGAFPNGLAEPRLSCAIGFRDRNHRIDVPGRYRRGAAGSSPNCPPTCGATATGTRASTWPGGGSSLTPRTGTTPPRGSPAGPRTARRRGAPSPALRPSSPASRW